MQCGIRKCLIRNNYRTIGLPCGLDGKESACDAGDLDSIPGLGRSPGEEKGYPLQYSGLENTMDGVVCRADSPWVEQGLP